MKESEFITQVGVVVGIALLMTVGVYSLVAGVVKLDDAGMLLLKNKAHDLMGKLKRSSGKAILYVASYLMKLLSIVGTIAMFIVGGGILVHGLPNSHEILHHANEVMHAIPIAGNVLAAITPTLINTFVGVLLGGVIVGGGWLRASSFLKR